jgi:murein DD-endopeptidase MepM/ murein hydrolase activator NlpD
LGDGDLDQGRLRASGRKGVAETIDLGHEPPLSVDGHGGLDRRRVSVQWFSGTILTGLCGAALMGGAVFASLDGETTFAAAPEWAGTSLRGALSNIGDHATGLRKTNRLPTFIEAAVEREILRVPTITRTRNRETVRVRPYERVFGNLSLTISDISAKIPPFNPQKLLAAAVAGDDQAATPQPDPEVSFSICNFAASPPRGKAGPGVCELSSLLPKERRSTLLPVDEIMERVRDVARGAGFGVPVPAGPDRTGSLRLGYASDNQSDPYLGFEARIVPMNVTLLGKTQASAAHDDNEHVVVAKKNDTVASILHDLGAAPDQIKQILAVLGPQASGPLKEGQRLRILLAPPSFGRVLPLRVIVEDNVAIETAAALSDTGEYVPVDIHNVDTDADQSQTKNADVPEGGATLYQSLYETALRNNVPQSVVDEMVRIYAYDVDFERKVQPGDTFDVLYSEDTNGDGTHEVRFASLTVGGETKNYYHFRTTDDGQYDYYDATGKSAKKFLVRKPVAVGVETSPFGWRIHPIAHVREFHAGVDWAAPLGTPIFAAGNGTIEEIGPKGGYGKYVLIRHADGYETAYGHMTAFARGLQVGSHVRQGQVIGFVGSTGISTGAHVHFEIHINGRFVNPMTVKLPRGRVLEGATLAEFERDRHQLDALMANSPSPRIAQAR